MGQTKSMPQGLLGSRRAPQRQLERAEAERPKWGIKAVAALVLCLVHCNYGLYGAPSPSLIHLAAAKAKKVANERFLRHECRCFDDGFRG